MHLYTCIEQKRKRESYILTHTLANKYRHRNGDTDKQSKKYGHTNKYKHTNRQACRGKHKNKGINKNTNITIYICTYIHTSLHT